MNPETKKLIGFVCASIGTLLAGLGTLPVDSKDLPLPESWRPYIISVGFFAATADKWYRAILIAWEKYKNLNP